MKNIWKHIDKTYESNCCHFAGAFESIKESANRSQVAQRHVDSTTRIIRQSESVRQQADSLIRNRKNDFDRIYNKNEVTVRDINVTLSEFRRKIVDLNDVVSSKKFYRLNSKKITINWILLRLKNLVFFSF